MGITIFRHGETEYKQPYHTTLDEACDLTGEGVASVNEHGHRFVNETELTDVMMYASPMGRTIHTAQILRSVLESAGVYVEDLVLDERLTEVRDFLWELFVPLVEGGEVNYEGNRYIVDASKTNPKGMTRQEYFFRDESHELVGIPKWYKHLISRWERCGTVSDRMDTFLRDVMDYENVIAVTHEALAYEMIHRFTEGKEQALPRSHYVKLEKKDNGLYVVEAAGNKKGNSQANILL